MKKKKGFTLRNVCGEHIVVAEGLENINFDNIITLNETAAYMWENAPDDGFNSDDLAQLLTKEYDVDETTARRDAAEVMQHWLKIGITE